MTRADVRSEMPPRSGDDLRLVRVRYRIPATLIARAMGVSHTSIWRLERRSHLTESQQARYSAALRELIEGQAP